MGAIHTKLIHDIISDMALHHSFEKKIQIWKVISLLTSDLALCLCSRIQWCQTTASLDMSWEEWLKNEPDHHALTRSSNMSHRSQSYGSLMPSQAHTSIVLQMKKSLNVKLLLSSKYNIGSFNLMLWNEENKIICRTVLIKRESFGRNDIML